MEVKDNILVNGENVFSVANSAGLKFSIFDNGVVENITCGKTQINLITASPLGNSCCNLYLRKRGEKFSSIALIGSAAECCIDENTCETKGEFEGMQFRCRLLLCPRESKWLWSVKLTNLGDTSAAFDLLYVQDVGLACADGNEKNDYYISQYVDYTPLLDDKAGYVVCGRQNEHGKGNIPWLAIGSLSKAISFSTDGQQFFGSSYRQTTVPESLAFDKLGGLKQGEFGVVAVQCEPFILKPNQTVDYGFFGIYQANHPSATTQADLKIITPAIEELRELANTEWAEDCVYCEPVENMFSRSQPFVAEDINSDDLDVLFGSERRNSEVYDGSLLSFFYGDNRHVVLRQKELLTYRPCGHIILAGGGLPGDEAIMSGSCFMFGAFLTHLVQGNVNFNRLLSVNTNAFNFIRHSGLRIFVKQAEQYYQLALPSAFEMSLNQCRWIYKQGKSLFEIICKADDSSGQISIELNIIKGSKSQWLISCELAAEHNWRTEANGTLKLLPGVKSKLQSVYPGGHYVISFDNAAGIEQIGSDEMLMADGRSRGLNFVVIKVGHTDKFVMSIEGKLATQNKTQSKKVLETKTKSIQLDFSSVQKSAEQIGRIAEMLPWFAHNARVHCLAPHGLEQYGGAAWGTRDVCQGPIEMLIAMGEYGQVRSILTAIFANQNPDGNWPQWWMFDRYVDVRADESHGDVVFWPIIALCEYIECCGDYDFLEAIVPYYNQKATLRQEPASVLSHVMCAVEHISTVRFAGNTKLVNYSDGDWDDAMQPADKSLKKKLISSWTVALSYEAFNRLAAICREANRIDDAERFEKLCREIRFYFNSFLISDGVVAGFGLRDGRSGFELLLHPSDDVTGINYRLLPMVQGILSEVFTPGQAKSHIELIEKMLKGPDGVRLMDRPVEYHGGIQKIFRRAESSAFFGREIGLMYSHAHLRYAEALARLGMAEAFVNALLQIVPIDIQKIVPQADIRQSNCYYSSSDGDFVNRSDASNRYADLIAGKVPVKGGWRVYSSGSGMFVSFVIRYLLGVRRTVGRVIFDPVMPDKFDGLAANMTLCGKDVKLVYHIGKNHNGVSKIEVNGKECDFDREVNQYRIGGAIAAEAVLKPMLDRNNNIIKIYI